MSNIQDLVNKYKSVPGERFFEDVFVKKEYEAIIDKKADIVFDVGACAGEFSAYIYDKAGVIYAFEPFSPYFNELIDNINEFALSKIKPYDLALSDSNGLGYLSDNAERGGNHLVDRIENTTPVQTTTLAQFINMMEIPHIDILKIDIEGDESRVFGAKDFPEVAPLISCIIGEHLDSVQNILEANGFIKRVLQGNFNTLYEKRIL